MFDSLEARWTWFFQCALMGNLFCWFLWSCRFTSSEIFLQRLQGKIPHWTEFPPGKRAVATIRDCGAIAFAPIGIAEPHFWNNNTMTILLWRFSRNFHKIQKYVVKFRGLRPRTPFYLSITILLHWIQQYII